MQSAEANKRNETNILKW